MIVIFVGKFCGYFDMVELKKRCYSFDSFEICKERNQMSIVSVSIAQNV